MISCENDQAYLPPIQTYEETAAQQPPEFLKGDKWFDAIIEPEAWLDFTEKYEEQSFVYSFRGRPFARLGDVQIVSGQAGNGKTMLFCQLIATLLKGEFGELRYELSETLPNPRVLLVDTEQSRNDVIACKNRIAELCGFGTQQTIDNFKICMLRSTETAVGRWRKTLRAIYEVQPNIVVLDGLLDVVEDFNSQQECAEIIYKCLQTASNYKAAMLCVLHQNPLSQKLTGHLGSAAMRKVSDILVVSKNRKCDEVSFSVTQAKARGHQDIEDWQFRVIPSLWGRPEQICSVVSSDVDIDLIAKWLRDGQGDIKWPATSTEIKTIFKQRGNSNGNDKLQVCLTRARNRRLIVEQPRDEWEPAQKFTKFYLNCSDNEPDEPP